MIMWAKEKIEGDTSDLPHIAYEVSKKWTDLVTNDLLLDTSDKNHFLPPGPAANAAIDHMRTWALGSAANDWVSMGIYSDGSYGIAEGLIYSFPVTCSNGDWTIVQGLEIDAFSQEKMDATEKELTEERDAVAHLLP